MVNSAGILNRHEAPTFQWLESLVLSALLLCFVSGCDDGALGGGGSTEPTVRVLVDNLGGEDADEDDDFVVAGYGTLTGRVVLNGALPSLPPNPPTMPAGELKDPAICVRERIPNETLVVGPSNGIQNVFVFLPRKPRGTPEELTEPPAETVTFDQEFCKFIPHAVVLQAGQEMRIKNSDGTVHNTNISGFLNTAVGANESEGVPYTYARGERKPVRVVCDFHPWMLAWHLPLDHPYGAATDETGSFTIENIPAGTHEFAIYHEGQEVMEVTDYTVTIEPDLTTEVEILISGDALLGSIDPGQLRTVVFSSLP